MFGRIAPMGTGSFEFAFHIRYYRLPVQSMLAAQIYGWTTATVIRRVYEQARMRPFHPIILAFYYNFAPRFCLTNGLIKD